jgi:hypothetical protein
VSTPTGFGDGVRLKRVRVKSFRSFDDCQADLPARLVFVCGPNESGKTGIMEAIRLGLFGDASTQSQAVRQQAKWGTDGDFRIEITLEDCSGDWLIVRDFGTRRNHLTGPDGIVHRDKNEIGDIVADVMGLPKSGGEEAYLASAYIGQDQLPGDGEALKKLLEERVVGTGVDVLKLARDATTKLGSFRAGPAGRGLLNSRRGS